METKKSTPMECQLKGCTKPAALTDRCFAFCTTKHKAKQVGKEIRDIPNHRLSVKEIQLKLKQMGREAAKKNAPKPKNEQQRMHL